MFFYFPPSWNQVRFRRVWFCKPLTEAEFSDDIKGLQPEMSFFGISYQQVCDLNPKFFLWYYHTSRFAISYLWSDLFSAFTLQNFACCWSGVFLSIGFKSCEPVFFKEDQPGALPETKIKSYMGLQCLSHSCWTRVQFAQRQQCLP
jgi:hypothetical protein